MSENSADRAMRAMADAAVAGAAPESEMPIAGTVLVLRDGANGPEVLMIERPDRGSFGGAWVFPGGKVEASDRLSEEEPEEEVARRAGARETLEETGLVVEPGVTLSLWDPPETARPRIRTWFFLAADSGGDVTLAADEAVSAEWVRPVDLLERHARDEAVLYPPTWVTLFQLARAPSSADILTGARFEHFATRARREASGLVLMWPGDDEYDEDAAGPARHRLQVGALPWVYTRTTG